MVVLGGAAVSFERGTPVGAVRIPKFMALTQGGQLNHPAGMDASNNPPPMNTAVPRSLETASSQDPKVDP